MRYLFFLIFSFGFIYAQAHIFVYHRFSDDRYPSANTSIEELTKQFEYFKKNNYKVVDVEDIVSKLEKKEKIPSNWVALAIDDAYKSFYTHGFEVFKKYKYPFSLYVYVEATDKGYKDFMSWEELKEADKYGSIGLHSYSHPKLQNLSDKEIIKDTKKAYDIFTKEMGYKPNVYVYPYGEYTEHVKNILINNFDFKSIMNQNSGSINNKTDIYDVPRVALVGNVNLKHKLRYTTFDVKWHEPKEFPKDGILKNINASVDKKYKKLKLYITGYGWQDVKVKDGIVDVTLNIKLKKDRTRVMLGPDVFTISNKILNKIKKKEN